MLLAVSLLTAAIVGCNKTHLATLEATKLPPPQPPVVFHSSRVLVDISERTEETQCTQKSELAELCFVGVRQTLEDALLQVLRPSFPDVVVLDEAEAQKTGDYLLTVELNVQALQPDSTSAGWSAGARGHFKLSRDGAALVGAGLASRSRADFIYDDGLGIAGAEVVNAIAAHIGQVLATLSEPRPPAPALLPPVVTRGGYMVIPEGAAPARAKVETRDR